MSINPDSADALAHLRQQWLAQADAVFDLYYQRDPLAITFTDRETRAVALTKELAAFLLEQDLAADPAVAPAADQPALCPRCQRPSQRRSPPDQPLPRRQVTSSAGEVTLTRQQWHCKTCRVSFFPSGPQAATDHRGL